MALRHLEFALLFEVDAMNLSMELQRTVSTPLNRSQERCGNTWS